MPVLKFRQIERQMLCADMMKIVQILPFRKRPKGLGDIVAAMAKPIAKALGKTDCGGCKKRQEKLNQIFPL